MLLHWVWFAGLKEMDGRQKLWLLQRFRTPEDIYRLDRFGLRGLELPDNAVRALMNKNLDAAGQIVQSCMEKQIGILVFTDSAYPERLRNIDDPPMVLYYKGKVPNMELQPVLGVVGTRKASPYGLRAAAAMGNEIAACGAIIISGGAEGIDTMAMQGALDAGQITVSVQAGGLDTLYPKSNRKLFERVMEKGCILSEYPPGVPSYRGNFLRRNRIISGISNGVLVVEAPKISGALNTARWAFEQGRDVFVVPGNIDVESCAGSNGLIGDIAQPALSGWAVVKEYAPFYPGSVRQVNAPKYTIQIPQSQEKVDKITVDKPAESPYIVKEKYLPELSEQEKTVVAMLTDKPIPVDTVIEQVKLPAATVMTVLTKLSIKGIVKLHPGKYASLK